jgi:TRAP-type C4-dicarboxylate transport system permease small subunit
MKARHLVVALPGCLLATSAFAGATPVLGIPLGSVLGSALPVAGVLSVAAISLLIGIRIVRRKR